ncbi:unnamed protein product [Meganyctiphanes norvegica]|uniref:Ig-like domain-containing protein n=1 Tax=Meganyctiphanes norvegica TaxID=48144 RepID=A0AAV2QKB7_MEGNR
MEKSTVLKHLVIVILLVPSYAQGPAKPSIIFPEKEIQANEGEEVELQCGVNGDLRRCVWTQNQAKELQVDDVYSEMYIQEYGKPNSTKNNQCGITIHNVTMEDAGSWICKVMVKGKTLTNTLTLFVNDASETIDPNVTNYDHDVFGGRHGKSFTNLTDNVFDSSNSSSYDTNGTNLTDNVFESSNSSSYDTNGTRTHPGLREDNNDTSPWYGDYGVNSTSNGTYGDHSILHNNYDDNSTSPTDLPLPHFGRSGEKSPQGTEYPVPPPIHDHPSPSPIPDHHAPPPAPKTQPDADADEEGRRSNTTSIILILIAVVILIPLIVCLLWYFCCKNTKSHDIAQLEGAREGEVEMSPIVQDTPSNVELETIAEEQSSSQHLTDSKVEVHNEQKVDDSAGKEDKGISNKAFANQEESNKEGGKPETDQTDKSDEINKSKEEDDKDKIKDEDDKGQIKEEEEKDLVKEEDDNGVTNNAYDSSNEGIIQEGKQDQKEISENDIDSNPEIVEIEQNQQESEKLIDLNQDTADVAQEQKGIPERVITFSPDIIDIIKGSKESSSESSDSESSDANSNDWEKVGDKEIQDIPDDSKMSDSKDDFVVADVQCEDVTADDKANDVDTQDILRDNSASQDGAHADIAQRLSASLVGSVIELAVQRVAEEDIPSQGSVVSNITLNITNGNMSEEENQDKHGDNIKKE